MDGWCGGGCRGVVGPALRGRTWHSDRSERLPEQPSRGFAVAIHGAFDDVRGKLGARWFLVPLAAIDELEEVVPDELLVEGVLLTARLIVFGRPIAAGVGSEDFVADEEVAIRFAIEVDGMAKLKLGVGENDASRRGIVGGGVIDREGEISKAIHEILARNFAGSLEVDIFVVPFGRLRGWGEDRVRETATAEQSFGKLDPADGAVVLIFAPTAPREVAAGDAFDRDDFNRSTQHHPTFQHRSLGGGETGDVCGFGRDEMIADQFQIPDEVEPPETGLGEKLRV